MACWFWTHEWSWPRSRGGIDMQVCVKCGASRSSSFQFVGLNNLPKEDRPFAAGQPPCDGPPVTARVCNRDHLGRRPFSPTENDLAEEALPARSRAALLLPSVSNTLPTAWPARGRRSTLES